MLIDVNCKGCNKLLFKAVLFVGSVKCHRCKMIFEYKVLSNIHMTSTADPGVLNIDNG